MPGLHFKVSAVLPIAASDYFIERDSAAFRSLISKSMKVGSLDIVDGWMEGKAEIYKFVTMIDVDKYVPKSFQRHFAKQGLQYTDIITYDPKLIACPPYRLPVKSIAPILPEKSRIECMLTIEDEQPGVSCCQTLEGEVEFKLLGLGHLAQRIVVDNLEKVYQGMPLVVQRWVDFGSEVLQHEGGRDILFSGRPDNHGIGWISNRITAMVQAPYSRQQLEEAAQVALPAGRAAVPDQATSSQSGQLQPSTAATEAGSYGEAAQTTEAATADGQQEGGEDDVYYDALDDWAWADEEAMLDSCAATQAAVRTDHAAAAVWIRQASQKRLGISRIDITAAADTNHTPSAPGDTHPDGTHKHRTAMGRRFSKTFHMNQAAWDKFLGPAPAWGLVSSRSSSPSSPGARSSGDLGRSSQGSPGAESEGRHAEWRPGAVMWLPRSIGRAGSAAALRVGQLIKQCSSLGARGEEK